jgi:hypothetical protein
MQFDRRRFLATSAAFLAAGCATEGRSLGTLESTQVPAPAWRMGDRWTYRRTDFYTKLDAGTVTREVVAADDKGIRVMSRTLDGKVLDEAVYASPGIQVSGNLSEDSQAIAGTLKPPYERYAFPLTSSKRWQQTISRTDPGGMHYRVLATTHVQGWETIKAANRDMRAIIIRRDFNLGPKDPFQGDLYRYEIEWYAPELRGPARLQIEEWYFEYRDMRKMSQMPGARYLYQLDSFSVN